MAGPAPVSIGTNDWPVLSRLLDAALLRPPEERNAWIDRLDGDDARLKAVLRELLAKDRGELPPIPPLGGPTGPAERHAGAPPPPGGPDTQPRAAGGPADRGEPVDELGRALGRFVGGLSDVDDLRGVFRDYLRRWPEQREAVSRWLGEAVQSGRVSTATLLTIRDLIAPAANDASASVMRMSAAGAPAAVVEDSLEAISNAEQTGLRSSAASSADAVVADR